MRRALSPKSLVALSLIVALVLLAGWRLWTLGMADHLARNNPEAALTWRPGHPFAAVRAAETLAQEKREPDRDVPWPVALHRSGRCRAYRVRGRSRSALKRRLLRLLRDGRGSRAARCPGLWSKVITRRVGHASPAHADLMIRTEPNAQLAVPLAAGMAAFRRRNG